MDSSLPDRLSPLQRDLLEAFFRHERRFHLTGGAALAGFYLGHRQTDDLDFFGGPGLDLEDAARALAAAAGECDAQLRPERTFPDFRRYVAGRDAESCIVDLVIDRAPDLGVPKVEFGAIRVDPTREILANKFCALLGRAEPKDLVDIQALLQIDPDLDRALIDAARKDLGVEPAALSWVLGQMALGPGARVPAGIDPVDLDHFRRELAQRLARMAFERTRS